MFNPAPPTQTGSTATASSCPDIQTRINAAAKGDTIKIPHTFDCTVALSLPPKAGGGVVLVETDTPNLIPAYGTRVALTDGVNMPILRGNTGNSPIVSSQTNTAIDGYRFVGIQFLASTTTDTDSLIFIRNAAATTAGTSVSNVIFDRVIVRGTGTTHYAKRGFFVSGVNIGVVNSYVDNFYAIDDAQAIAPDMAPGPYIIDNNTLIASGENILIGADCPANFGMIPADLTITRNYMFKPLSWKSDDPSWDHINRTIKNTLEFKGGNRALVEGNVLSQNWAQGQQGYTFLLTPRNAQGTCSFNLVQDITFRKNIVKNIGKFANFLRVDGGPPGGGLGPTTTPTNRVLVQNNLSYNWDGTKWLTGGPIFVQQLGGIPNTVIDHNTTIMASSGLQGAREIYCDATGGTLSTGLYANNSLMAADQSNGASILANADGGGTSALNTCTTGGYTVTANAWWNIPGLGGTYPAGNSFPTAAANVGFVDATTCATTGGSSCALTPASPFHNAGSDGFDIGANVAAVLSATSGVEVGP